MSELDRSDPSQLSALKVIQATLYHPAFTLLTNVHAP